MGVRVANPYAPEVQQFLDALSKSQLLADRLTKKLVERLPEFPELSQDVNRLAQNLVEQHLLTKWQAYRLRSGEWEDFYLGKYRLMQPFGGGGMGRLFLAEHYTMHRLVVLKMLHESLVSDAASRARFLRETRALAALRHPNIVQAFDHDQFRGHPFLVMEFVEGKNLQDVVQENGPLAWPRAAHYITQVSAGLQHAHENGLVHRDIKPGNLLLESDGVVKLLDLGLASFFQKRHHNTVTTSLDNEVLGTADYLAPEQAIDFHNVDIRADIYSLGAVFFFLITGKPPFDGGSYAQKLLFHQTQLVPTLASLGVTVPTAVEKILQTMMAKDPLHRPQTPNALIRLLQPFAQTGALPFQPSKLHFRRAELQKWLGKGPNQLRAAAETVAATAVADEPTKRLFHATAPDQAAPIAGRAPAKATAAASETPSRAQSVQLPATRVAPAEPRRAQPAVAASQTPKSGANTEAARHQPQSKRLPAVVPSHPVGSARHESSPARKRPSRRRRRRYFDPTLVVGLAIGLVGLLVVGGTVGYLIYRQAQLAKAEPNTTTNPGSLANQQAIEAPSFQRVLGDRQTKQELYNRWLNYSEQIRKHPQLVAYYPMNDQTKEAGLINNLAEPSKGQLNGRLGKSAQPETAPKIVAGRWPQKYGLAFDRPNSKQHVELLGSESGLLNFQKSFTVAVWFRPEATSNTFPALVNKGDTAWRLQIFGNRQKIEFALGNAVSKFSALVSDKKIVDGLWHLVVGVYDGTSSTPQMLLYIDGQLAAAQLRWRDPEQKKLVDIPIDTSKFLESVPVNSHPVMIGNNSEKFDDNRSFIGVIDEVYIFQAPLNATDVQQMYQAGNPYE